MNFRYHRGGFDESMATLRQFSSREEMLSTLTTEEEATVVVNDYGFDDRLNAETLIVVFEKRTPSEGGVLGFAWEPVTRS